jgi:hypothetical protein
MFFFSPEEADDYRNEKRRRVFEQAQEERVKARLEEDKLETEGEVDDDPWGGSDEEVSYTVHSPNSLSPELTPR